MSVALWIGLSLLLSTVLFRIDGLTRQADLTLIIAAIMLAAHLVIMEVRKNK